MTQNEEKTKIPTCDVCTNKATIFLCEVCYAVVKIEDFANDLDE